MFRSYLSITMLRITARCLQQDTRTKLTQCQSSSITGYWFGKCRLQSVIRKCKEQKAGGNLRSAHNSGAPTDSTAHPGTHRSHWRYPPKTIQNPAKEPSPVLSCICHQEDFPTSWLKAPLSVSFSSRRAPCSHLCTQCFLLLFFLHFHSYLQKCTAPRNPAIGWNQPQLETWLVFWLPCGTQCHPRAFCLCVPAGPAGSRHGTGQPCRALSSTQWSQQQKQPQNDFKLPSVKGFSSHKVFAFIFQLCLLAWKVTICSYQLFRGWDGSQLFLIGSRRHLDTHHRETLSKIHGRVRPVCLNKIQPRCFKWLRGISEAFSGRFYLACGRTPEIYLVNRKISDHGLTECCWITKNAGKKKEKLGIQIVFSQIRMTHRWHGTRGHLNRRAPALEMCCSPGAAPSRSRRMLGPRSPVPVLPRHISRAVFLA